MMSSLQILVMVLETTEALQLGLLALMWNIVAIFAVNWMFSTSCVFKQR